MGATGGIVAAPSVGITDGIIHGYQALIDWEKRMQFGQHQNMAKALQRLVATSADPVQRYALDWLKSKLEYSGRMRDFTDAIEKAMRELERLEIIVDGRIDASSKGKPQAIWTRL